MIRVVVRREQLAEQAAPTQTTGQLIDDGLVTVAALAGAASEIALDRLRPSCGADLVHVHRQPVGVQAQTPFTAGAVYVRSREAHALDPECGEVSGHVAQSEREAAIDDQGTVRRPEAHPSDGPIDDDGGIDAAPRIESTRRHAASREAGQTLSAAGQGQIRE